MVTFNKIFEGQILYDRHKQKTMIKGLSEWGEWQVEVKQIDKEKRIALCSWNTNPARWYSERQIEKLHTKRYQPKDKKVV